MQHLTNYEHTHIKHRCQCKEGMDRERERELSIDNSFACFMTSEESVYIFSQYSKTSMMYFTIT